jgi:ubiquinone/menaquinone biosynthesis C-methylase UbiE
MVCPSWLSFILYNPVRKAFTCREAILNESGVTANSVVLEVGAGNGFLTEALAERSGKVYAVELQEGMLSKLRRRVARFGEKVSLIKGDISLIPLDEELADVCILYYSFHEFGDKEKAADTIGEAIKQGGLLSIYEPAFEVGKRSMQKTVAMFAGKGFIQIKARDTIFTRFALLQKTSRSDIVPAHLLN